MCWEKEWMSRQSPVLQELTDQLQRLLTPHPTLGEWSFSCCRVIPLSIPWNEDERNPIKYPRWRGNGARGWEGRRVSFMMSNSKWVLLCYLSIRSMDLACGPRYTLSPPSSTKVLGSHWPQLGHLSFVTSAACLEQTAGLSWEVPVPLLLTPICPNLQWVHSETCAFLTSFISPSAEGNWWKSLKWNEASQTEWPSPRHLQTEADF